MNWGRIALDTAVYAASGAALVILLWPTERASNRFLRRWGIVAPSRQQSLIAARYLRVRRLLYLALFVIMPPAVAAVFEAFDQPESASGMLRLFTPLIAALLVAEVVAALRQVRGVRVAVLARRTWRDLVPAWAVALLLGLAAPALALAGIGLAAQPWADRVAAALPPNTDTTYIAYDYRAEITHPPSWLVIAGTLLCLAAVLGLVRLAVRRHAVADPDVDIALRARTARVVVGIGMAWLAQMALLAANRFSLLNSLSVRPEETPAPPGWLATAHALTPFLGITVLFVAAVGWIFVVTPRQTRSLQPTT